MPADLPISAMTKGVVPYRPQPRGFNLSIFCHVNGSGPDITIMTILPICGQANMQLKRIITLEHGQATKLTPYSSRFGAPVLMLKAKSESESVRRCTQNHVNVDQCHSPGNMYPLLYPCHIRQCNIHVAFGSLCHEGNATIKVACGRIPVDMCPKLQVHTCSNVSTRGQSFKNADNSFPKILAWFCLNEITRKLARVPEIMA